MLSKITKLLHEKDDYGNTPSKDGSLTLMGGRDVSGSKDGGSVSLGLGGSVTGVLGITPSPGVVTPNIVNSANVTSQKSVTGGGSMASGQSANGVS